MKKNNHYWTVKQLWDNIHLIEFPEFQREPTVWKLSKKQKLIDSIIRDFDIAAIYLYKTGDNSYDCIDGRQRINAIMSFLGKNEADLDDNGFHIKVSNEIFSDGEKFNQILDKRFISFPEDWKKRIFNYKINVVEIDNVESEEELNLLFLRLQLGAILNAGEKLNAMTGDMRDYIFHDLSKHTFFTSIKIPYRRFAREQVAAQIAINYFSKKEEGVFQKSRFVDLQDFFKEKSRFNSAAKKYAKEISNILTKIETYFGNKIHYIRNRAIAVSVFLFVSELIETGKEKDVKLFIEFLIKFLKTLKWQISKGVMMDSAYYDLLKFNTNIAQAAVEKPAIERRHDFLKDYFHAFKNTKSIRGDREYKAEKGVDPNKERESIII
jgi:hypothetical protein